MSASKLIRDASTRKSEVGAALVVVLVLLVLMLGIILAFFSQSILQKQISKSSSAQTASELLAAGATAQIIGDLKQEISDGSTGANKITVGNGSAAFFINRPDSYQKAVPAFVPSGMVGTGTENLVKISKSGQEFYPNGVKRGSSASTETPAVNGRFVSKARWNRPLLMKANSSDDLTPPTTFQSPDWVLINRSGENPPSGGAWTQDLGQKDVTVGRYAYVIYNEGGLLDANVAGYTQDVKQSTPSFSGDNQGNTTLSVKDQTIYKTGESYADLTAIGLTQPQVDALVNWRNASTLGAGGPTGASNYFDLTTRNRNGFLSVSSLNTPGDNMFVGRQQLLSFFQNKLGGSVQDALQYLGTFGRYLNRPSYFPDPNRTVPTKGNATTTNSSSFANGTFPGGNSSVGNGATPKDYNPPLQSVLVTNPFDRLDGSRAKAGEPIFKRRFALDRLCWLTWAGPSAAATTTWDAYEKLGVSQELLKQGTPENILKYFGLVWTAPASGGPYGGGGYWTYNHGAKDQVLLLKNLPGQGREPDFFEILQAAINVGSLAKGSGGFNSTLDYPGGTFQTVWDTNVDYHIIQIGANIIDCANPSQYPTQIRLADTGGGYRKFFGKQDLPYINAITVVPFVVKASTPPAVYPGNYVENDPTQVLQPPYDATSNGVINHSGWGVALLFPTVWNPYDRNGPPPTGGGPTSLRVTALTGFPPTNDVVTNSADVGLLPKCNGGSSAYQSEYSQSGNWVSPRYGWTRDSSAITFSNVRSLYREPTVLAEKDVPAGSNLQLASTNLIKVPGTAPGGLNWTDGISDLVSPARKLVGIYLGKFNLRWSATNDPTKVYTAQNIVMNRAPVTFRVEYQTSNGNWAPYEERYVGLPFSDAQNFDPSGTRPVLPRVGQPADNVSSYYEGAAAKSALIFSGNTGHKSNSSFDPRTPRWGQVKDLILAPKFNDVAANDNAIPTWRPTTAFSEFTDNLNGPVNTAAGWKSNNGQIQMGPESENKKSGTMYYEDADGVIRRASGGYSGSSVSGLPMATQNGTNRPVILHRPYRSVSELGYVYRDTPWKNIDFFTPESGDTALLDAFCIHDDARGSVLASGKVDLNTRQIPVLKALLKGAYRDSNQVGDTLTEADATSMAQALVNFTTDGSKGPLSNISELIGRVKPGGASGTAIDGSSMYQGFTGDLGSTSGTNLLSQRFREAAVRGLSDTGQAGVWNLLIDVIAQSGKYTKANDPTKFMVEGETRYWVHVALDRQTGKILDQQVEVVSE
jgi:hypothetical protein